MDAINRARVREGESGRGRMSERMVVVRDTVEVETTGNWKLD